MSDSETMRAVEVKEAGGDFEVVEKEIPEPAADEVRVDVAACGVCHSDAFMKEGHWPGLEYPRTPGHEVVGRIDAVGDDVSAWDIGDRVGVGWHGGHCFECEACRRGQFVQCENADVTGFDHDGGFAEFMTAPQETLARAPEELDAAGAAPLLCAGITTFNALRNSDAQPGDLVAVQGIGGLGHLGVQFAHEAGFETVAVSRGTDKRDLAFELGADHYVDSEAENPAEALQALGGAKVILGAAPHAGAIESITDGLGLEGEFIAVGLPNEPIEVDLQSLVHGRSSVSGWASGDARASQDTLEFSALRDVEATVETYELEEADEAFERMMASEARFRAVLEP